jgi:hypothetical protein
MDYGEGMFSRFKKKKKNDKRRRDDNLVVAVERNASRPKGNPAKVGLPKDHFEKLLDASCPHNEVPVKHALKDYHSIKNYVNDTLKPRAADPPKKAAPPPDNNDDDAGAQYPGEDGAIHMIFGRSPARPSRQRDKLIRREVFNADSAKPSYLKCSEVPITFDRKDHPDNLPTSGSSSVQIQTDPQGPDG